MVEFYGSYFSVGIEEAM